MPGTSCCLCLRDASIDLRHYTRLFVSLLFLIHVLDHPVDDSQAFFLEHMAGRVTTNQFGLRLIRRFDCKILKPQLGRTYCEMHDNASHMKQLFEWIPIGMHAYQLSARPMFCFVNYLH